MTSKRVKMIKAGIISSFEDKVNDFLAEEVMELIDIKYGMTHNEYGTASEYTAMIIYLPVEGCVEG